MSGGVDSSVAAHLLLEAGHEVIGLFMRHGITATTTCDSSNGGQLLPIITSTPAGHKKGCCTAADAADARRVADRMDIPFYTLNMEDDFERIIDYFVDEYSSGRTPNPCVVCNNWLKFGRLFDFADSLGANYVATGHYARLAPGKLPTLHKGLDEGKDQSYVLFGIDPQKLARIIFPVGAHTKPAIRELASELGLSVADKRDSQEICFVPDGNHADLVKARRGSESDGEIVTESGVVVGRHSGIEKFTVGQRKGLGLALGEPHFVVRIDSKSRQIVIGPRASLACKRFIASRSNWLVSTPTHAFHCRVKVRYNSRDVIAKVAPLANDRFEVELLDPFYGIAPGQAAVCYQGDQVLGGGWIESIVD